MLRSAHINVFHARLGAVLAVLAGAMTLVFVAPAAAQSTTITDQDVEDVSSALVDQAPESAQLPDIPLTDGGSLLEQQLADPATDDYLPPEPDAAPGPIRSFFYRIGEKVNAFPKLELLGRFSLALTAGGVGWELGTKIRHLLTGDTADDYQGAVAPDHVTFVDKGHLFFANGLTGHRTVAPEPGRLYDYQGTSTVYIRTTIPGYTCDPGIFWASGPRVQILRGQLVAEPKEDTGTSGGCTQRTAVLFDPLSSGDWALGCEGTDPPCVTIDPTPAYNGPPPQTAQALEDAVRQELESGDYQTLVETLHRCIPDPSASSVVVPQVLPGESPGDYEDCLDSLGLQVQELTLAETDTTVPNGGIVDTNPEGGVQVQTGSTIDVELNPPEAVGERDEGRCLTGPPQGPVPPAPADGTPFPAYQLAPSPTGLPAGYYPVTVGKEGFDAAPLRWGTVKWGWAHIRRKHSYSAVDELQTTLALLTDPDPLHSVPTLPQYHYHYYFTVADPDGGVIDCVRTVTVEYFADKEAVRNDMPGIRGIQNSYTGEVVP